MKPVSVQIITYAPTTFTHCQHCELAFREVGIGQRLRKREAAEALPEDLALEYQLVSDWVHGLLERHGSRIRVDVLDAASIRGVLASVRHRIGRYPAVIVNGRATWTGLSLSAPSAEINRRVEASGSPVPTVTP
jgi:hypothetical protein